MTSTTIDITNIDFDKLFFPKAIGVIGVSPDLRGGTFFLRCMKGKFKGPIYLFNPKFEGQEIYGYKIYSTISDIKDSIDYVILAIPARLCPKVMEEIGKKGVPFVTIFASGFREVGRESLEKEILSTAKRYNVRIIGPNCLGVYNPRGGLHFAFDQSRKAVNFVGVFQSGGIAQNKSQL